jgi:hypothetical protein
VVPKNSTIETREKKTIESENRVNRMPNVVNTDTSAHRKQKNLIAPSTNAEAPPRLRRMLRVDEGATLATD